MTRWCQFWGQVRNTLQKTRFGNLAKLVLRLLEDRGIDTELTPKRQIMRYAPSPR